MTKMAERARKQLIRSWLVLLTLTGASVLAASSAGAATAIALVLCLAMFKARFVVLDFMDLRQKTPMARALIGWCLALGFGAAAKTIFLAVAGG